MRSRKPRLQKNPEKDSELNPDTSLMHQLLLEGSGKSVVLDLDSNLLVCLLLWSLRRVDDAVQLSTLEVCCVDKCLLDYRFLVQSGHKQKT